MSKTSSLNDFIHSLKEITISCNAETESDFVDIFKTGERMEVGIIFFNGTHGYNNFLSLVDRLIKNVLSEIDHNEQLYWDNNEKEDYFLKISDFINNYNKKFQYDPFTNSYFTKIITIAEPLNSPDINDYFIHDIQGIKAISRTLYEKYSELDIKLKIIPDYLTIINKKRKSTFGNKKIEWNPKLNKLVGFYFKQIEDGLIDTDLENLRLFLINNYTWRGKPLSESTIATYLDPNKKLEDLPKCYEGLSLKDFL
jgi:hypothetical protein